MQQLPFILSIQNTAAMITLFGLAVVSFTVIFLLLSAGKEEDKTEAKNKVYKVRRRYFWGLILVGSILLFYSFSSLPYARFKGNVDKTVTVIAYQWQWRMAKGASDANPDDFKGKDEISVPANKNIQFIVKARDVNHNFAIYNGAGDIVAQVQAMPGYVHKLIYNFKEPGDYHVACLEYCGLAHAYMTATIHVK